MVTTASFFRDANRVPITTDGVLTTKTLTFSGDGAHTNPIFTLTGGIEIRGLWGVITTDLGSNVTAAAWRINDQTAQVYLTAVGGTTLSSKKAGSMIVKKGLVATALSLVDNAAGAILEPGVVGTIDLTPVIILKKTAAVTQVEFCYTTNNTSAGEIQFFVRWLPMTSDSDLVAV